MISRIILIICIVFLLLGLQITEAGSNDPKLIVLNSDKSVDKYTIVQNEFNESIIYTALEADVSNDEWEEKKLKLFLSNQSPDLIYTIGTKSFLLANKYAHNKTVIVFSSVVNWLRFPMTSKMYGISGELHAGMQIFIFRYFFPNIQRIGIIYSKEYTEEWFNQSKIEAKKLGVELVGQETTKNIGLDNLIGKIDAFWMISEPAIMSDKKNIFRILKECDQNKLPVFTYHEALAKCGAVLVVAVDDATIGRQAADIITQIFKGEEVKDKIQFPAGSYVIFNQKKADEYGLPYVKEALRSADIILK
ncbi:MAG: hypothetical protein HQK76_09540 [Desulfobacterales bacterium]|nr:hypothetical protein [Desulfobacterales bacterium]